jgi:hypothetical protein
MLDLDLGFPLPVIMQHRAREQDGCSAARPRVHRAHRHESSFFALVADHFDVVPVWTDDERCEVFAGVVGAQAGAAIVLPPRLQSRPMKSFDLLAILSHERQMKMGRLPIGLEDAQ